MRIAQIIDSMNWGGAQKLLVTFGIEAGARDIDKLIVISLQKPKAEISFVDQLKSAGVEVHFLPATSLLSLSRLKSLVVLLRKEKIDIVHTHLLYANVVGGIAAWLSRIPTIASLHNIKNDPMRANKLRYLLETWVLKYHDYGVIAIGQLVAQVEKRRFAPEHIRVIPNAVEALPTLSSQARQQARKEFLDSQHNYLLISVGRLSAQKAFGDLFTALSLVVDEFPDVRLIIAGEGNQRKVLETKIKSLQMEKHIQLLGGRNDVPILLSASDIFVSSSHWEGLPIAVLEGMSAGLPIIGTRVGDMPYVVVEGETGLLVDPGDINKLALALRQLLEDGKTRRQMGVTGRKRMETIYSAKMWVDTLLEYYKECLNNA